MFSGGLVTTLGMPALHSALAHCVQRRTGNHLGDARFTFRVAHCVQWRTGNHLGDVSFTFRGGSLCSPEDW